MTFVTIKGRTRWNHRPVLSAVQRARRRVLMRGGFGIRKTAQASIITADDAAKPGRPPHGHVGHLRRLILVGYDAASGTVVVGPRTRKSKSGPGAAQMLEFGGRARRNIPRKQAAQRRNVRGQFRRKTVSVLARYAARPFMGPALRARAGQLARLWRDQVRAGRV